MCKKFEKMKRVITFFLVVTMLFGLVGCGKKEGDNSDEKDNENRSEIAKENAVMLEENADPFSPVSDKTVEIHIGREESDVEYPEGEDSYNNYIVKYLEEQLNVKYVYDFSVDSGSYYTKVSMAISSNTIPDVMCVSYGQMKELVEAGVVEDMTDAFYTYASDELLEVMDSTNGIADSNATFKGRLMAIPGTYDGMDSVSVMYIREDWRKELGLKEPETYEDVLELARAFVKKNPGGKVKEGISADLAIVQPSGGFGHINALFNAQGAFPKVWVTQEDGSVVYGSTTAEAKNALEQIRGLVEEGLMSASLATRDHNTLLEMLANGQTGIFFGTWYSYVWPVFDLLEGADKSVEWKAYLAPAAEDGKINWVMKDPAYTYLVVKKGVSEEVKEAVVKTLNYQLALDNTQAEELRSADTPYHWHYSPINMLNGLYNGNEEAAQNVMDCLSGSLAYENLDTVEKMCYDAYKKVEEAGLRECLKSDRNSATYWGYIEGEMLVQKNADKINKVYSSFYLTTPTMEDKWGTLVSMEEEFYLQVITGDKSIDDFDDFVKTWNALGGERITKEINNQLEGK